MTVSYASAKRDAVDKCHDAVDAWSQEKGA